MLSCCAPQSTYTASYMPKQHPTGLGTCQHLPSPTRPQLALTEMTFLNCDEMDLMMRLPDEQYQVPYEATIAEQELADDSFYGTRFAMTVQPPAEQLEQPDQLDYLAPNALAVNLGPPGAGNINEPCSINNLDIFESLLAHSPASHFPSSNGYDSCMSPHFNHAMDTVANIHSPAMPSLNRSTSRASQSSNIGAGTTIRSSFAAPSPVRLADEFASASPESTRFLSPFDSSFTDETTFSSPSPLCLGTPDTISSGAHSTGSRSPIDPRLGFSSPFFPYPNPAYSVGRFTAGAGRERHGSTSSIPEVGYALFPGYGIAVDDEMDFTGPTRQRPRTHSEDTSYHLPPRSFIGPSIEEWSPSVERGQSSSQSGLLVQSNYTGGPSFQGLSPYQPVSNHLPSPAPSLARSIVTDDSGWREMDSPAMRTMRMPPPTPLGVSPVSPAIKQAAQKRRTGDAKYQCEEAGCGDTFRRMANLQNHAKIHTGVRPFKCSQVGCPKTFSRSSDWRRHERHHQGVKDKKLKGKRRTQA